MVALGAMVRFIDWFIAPDLGDFCPDDIVYPGLSVVMEFMVSWPCFYILALLLLIVLFIPVVVFS